jgi:8-oxo-dGTP diphosphatase
MKSPAAKNPPPPPCAGVVVFRWREGEPWCLLVQTHTGQWGFPKGKRNKGESVVENALRELFEETGLLRLQINLHEDLAIDERSDKGNLAVRYLAATLSDPSPILVRQQQELQAVTWMRIAEAEAVLRPSRRDVLRWMRERVPVPGSITA